jgi:hypothetical protein
MTDVNRLIATLIDTAGFYGANYLLASPIHISHVEMHHGIIWALSDYAVRNGWITKIDALNLGAGRTKEDAYIAVIYALIASAFDAVIDKDNLKKAVLDNVIRGAIGFGTTVALDKFVVPTLYQ